MCREKPALTGFESRLGTRTTDPFIASEAVAQTHRGNRPTWMVAHPRPRKAVIGL